MRFKVVSRARMGGLAIITASLLAACGGSGAGSTTMVDNTAMDADTGMDADEDIAGGMMGDMMQVLSETEWEGMRIELASMPPTSFTIFQGDQTREVTPQPEDALHLMAILSDADTTERIPYADVWMTITDEDGNVVFDDRMWPMISQGMGTHYGVNVPLPAAGSYEAAIQITPPQVARHPEYADRWLTPRTVELDLEWEGS